ncbi:MAG: phosphoenolpyruvate kinase, partial [Myxococcales bacterium]|nr:phosphoenolpyruvate kinase [Myxococcales bacterium]
GLPGADRLPDADAARALAALLAKDADAVRRDHPAFWLAARVHARTGAKLAREAVEDFRIDFEDGFGVRPDAEEDHHAERTAREVARAHAAGTLPPFIGIRIKTLSEELKRRAMRTLDLFVSTLLAETGGVLPDGFVITLPKITSTEQVATANTMLMLLEDAHGLPRDRLKMELMVEVTQSILGPDGRCPLPAFHDACAGRLTGAHFGTYDYTASADITARHQEMDHWACDFAKEMMKVAFAGTGVFLSDGATNVMPAPPHRGEDLTAEQRAENVDVVHQAWRLSYRHIRHSLRNGFYQGWDLHPAQLPVRYAACYAFFLEGLDAATVRLRNFIEKAAQATLVGDVFDDAATGQGLLNYFLRALNAGAVTLAEVQTTGLTVDEIRSRSFLAILEGRRKGTLIAT